MISGHVSVAGNRACGLGRMGVRRRSRQGAARRSASLFQDGEGGGELTGDVCSRGAVVDGVDACADDRQRVVDAGDGFVGRGWPVAVSFGGSVVAGGLVLRGLVLRGRAGAGVVIGVLRWSIS